MIVDLFAIQNLKDGLCLLQVDVYFHEAGHIYKEYLLVVQSLLSFLQLLSVGAIILHAHDSFSYNIDRPPTMLGKGKFFMSN